MVKNMQKRAIKFQFIVILTLSCFVLKGADNQALLLKADSLFEKNKFTEARELYFDLYQKGQQSPATLLKMAYVHEGLGEFGQALFFLFSYYKITEDGRAYEKIQTLAKTHDISGYQLDPIEQIQIWMHNRLFNILPVLLVVGIFFMLLMVNSARHGNYNGKYASGFVSVLFIVMGGIALNFMSPNQRAVITQTSYCMSGPSSAANLLSIIPAGSQVQVKREQDIWVEVQWNNQRGFVHQADILQAYQ